MAAKAAVAILAFFAATSQASPALTKARSIHSFGVNQTNATIPHGGRHEFQKHPRNTPLVLEDGRIKRVLKWETKQAPTKGHLAKRYGEGPPNYDIEGTRPEFPTDVMVLKDPGFGDEEIRINCRDYGPSVHRAREIEGIDFFCKYAENLTVDATHALKFIQYNRDDNDGEGPWTAEYSVVAKKGHFWVVDRNTCLFLFRQILDECDVEDEEFKQGGVLATPALEIKLNNTLSMRMVENPDCWHWRDPGCPGEGFSSTAPNYAAFPGDYGLPDGGKETPFHYPTMAEEKKYGDGYVWPGCSLGYPFDIYCLAGREREGRPKYGVVYGEGEDGIYPGEVEDEERRMKEDRERKEEEEEEEEEEKEEEKEENDDDDKSI